MTATISLKNTNSESMLNTLFQESNMTCEHCKLIPVDAEMVVTEEKCQHIFCKLCIDKLAAKQNICPAPNCGNKLESRVSINTVVDHLKELFQRTQKVRLSSKVESSPEEQKVLNIIAEIAEHFTIEQIFGHHSDFGWDWSGGAGSQYAHSAQMDSWAKRGNVKGVECLFKDAFQVHFTKDKDKFYKFLIETINNIYTTPDFKKDMRLLCEERFVQDIPRPKKIECINPPQEELQQFHQFIDEFNANNPIGIFYSSWGLPNGLLLDFKNDEESSKNGYLYIWENICGKNIDKFIIFLHNRVKEQDCNALIINDLYEFWARNMLRPFPQANQS